MAQQDYFSGAGSKFGQLAGSILSSKRKRKKKDAFTAIAVSAFLETLGAKGQQLKQGLTDALTNLKEDFTLETLSRQYQYEDEKENRKLYKNYEANPEREIEKYAIELYNDDPDIYKHGVSFSNRGKLIGEVKTIDESIWQKKLRDAGKFFENLKNNPLVIKPTFIDYNRPDQNSYKAAFRRIKDDPTKEGALRNLASKAFPKRFDRRIAELDLAVEEQQIKVKAQEDTQKEFDPTIKDEVAYDKTQAVKYIMDKYSEVLDLNTLQEITSTIKNKKGDLGFTENDILSIAISTQILNKDNLGIVQKEVENATLLYNAHYKRKNEEIPLKDDTKFKVYSSKN